MEQRLSAGYRSSSRNDVGPPRMICHGYEKEGVTVRLLDRGKVDAVAGYVLYTNYSLTVLLLTSPITVRFLRCDSVSSQKDGPHHCMPPNFPIFLLPSG